MAPLSPLGPAALQVKITHSLPDQVPKKRTAWSSVSDGGMALPTEPNSASSRISNVVKGNVEFEFALSGSALLATAIAIFRCKEMLG